jgi:two-component sensor histidine kinase
MDPVYSKPENDVSRRSSFASFEDEANDLKLVLREAVHRMKNTLILLGASVWRELKRGVTGEMSTAVKRLETRIAPSVSLGDDLRPMSIEPFGALCQTLSGAILKFNGIRCEARNGEGVRRAEQCRRPAIVVTDVSTNPAKHPFLEPQKREGQNHYRKSRWRLILPCGR